MISRIVQEVVRRADDGKPIEDQVVVIITDGYENASREFTGQMIADLVAARRSGGLDSVFLGADQVAITDRVAIGAAEQSSGARWVRTRLGPKR
jgi:hypothetical protein